MLSLNKAFKNPSNYSIPLFLNINQRTLQVSTVQDMVHNTVPYTEPTPDFSKAEKASKRKREEKKEETSIIHSSNVDVDDFWYFLKFEIFKNRIISLI